MVDLGLSSHVYVEGLTAHNQLVVLLESVQRRELEILLNNNVGHCLCLGLGNVNDEEVLLAIEMETGLKGFDSWVETATTPGFADNF